MFDKHSRKVEITNKPELPTPVLALPAVHLDRAITTAVGRRADSTYSMEEVLLQLRVMGARVEFLMATDPGIRSGYLTSIESFKSSTVVVPSRGPSPLVEQAERHPFTIFIASSGYSDGAEEIHRFFEQLLDAHGIDPLEVIVAISRISDALLEFVQEQMDLLQNSKLDRHGLPRISKKKFRSDAHVVERKLDEIVRPLWEPIIRDLAKVVKS